ncbi:MAG: alcohol dehydrogenase catalytic domain-containing protein [Proteobacteria bacterium]|nr:alcohol dehydrogenase catalytic domain-containing protein [Pseudomonadota bacterium]
MQAVVFRKERGLVFEDVIRPDLEPDQVLVRVADTGFCGSDHTLVQSGNLPDGYILGHETSGTIVETGRDAREAVPGTRVIIRPTWCGTCLDCRSGRPYFCQNNRRSIGIGDLPGAFAEYIRVYPSMLIEVPEGVDSRNAALAEAFAASLHAVAVTGKKGGAVLVIGGGTIGLALVRLLKILDFGPVALSEPVLEKRELALGFGADAVIDPLTENLGLRVFETTNGTGFETVFECSGVPACVQAALDAAARGGTVCVVSVISRPVEIPPILLNFKEVWLTGSYSNTHEENRRVLGWMAEGRLDGRPLITDLIGLEELPEVYRDRIDTGRAIKVMLRIGEEF